MATYKDMLLHPGIASLNMSNICPHTIQQYSLWSFYFLNGNHADTVLGGMNNTHVCDKVLHVLGDHALMLEEWEKHAK